MINEYGYCQKCGTALKVEEKWEENYSGYGPAGRMVKYTYCPNCREEKIRKEEYKRRKKEEEERERKIEEERERQSKKIKRLEKYKKYMPKKVTAIVLTNQEAKYLFDLLDEEIKRFEKEKEIDNDNVYVGQVLIERIKKAKEETDYTLKESLEFAKKKGWENE